MFKTCCLFLLASFDTWQRAWLARYKFLVSHFLSLIKKHVTLLLLLCMLLLRYLIMTRFSYFVLSIFNQESWSFFSLSLKCNCLSGIKWDMPWRCCFSVSFPLCVVFCQFPYTDSILSSRKFPCISFYIHPILILFHFYRTLNFLSCFLLFPYYQTFKRCFFLSNPSYVIHTKIFRTQSVNMAATYFQMFQEKNKIYSHMWRERGRELENQTQRIK